MRYRQKTEDANVSAVILGLMGGKEGHKAFTKMLNTWSKVTNDGPVLPANNVGKFMADFASGGM